MTIDDNPPADVEWWLGESRKRDSFTTSIARRFWAGLFGDVARYGQERDTADLKVTQNTRQKIAFTAHRSRG